MAALAAGDLLLFTTDGVVEAMAPNRELFGMRRILDVAAGCGRQPSQQVATAICQAARDYREGQPQLDDITALVVRVW